MVVVIMAIQQNLNFISGRKAICKRCKHKEYKMFKWLGLICGKCKCLMNIKWTIPSAECPIGKW
jgi:hypothetical protein